MAPKEAIAHRLGDGTLKVGDTGSEAEFHVQCSKALITPSVKSDDDITLLGGSILPGDDEETWELSLTLYQEYSKTSLTVFCFRNRGKVLPFTYIPRDDQARKWTGKCKVRAIEDGGEVKKRNTTDATFPIVGSPELEDNVPTVPGG